MPNAHPVRRVALALALLILIVPAGSAPAQSTFDHTYAAYAALLREHVQGARVDYRRLVSHRGDLDAVVATFDDVTEAEVRAWPRDRQLAYWINAYNVFTLRAIVDHYPIRRRWFSLAPRSSIRQIDGVWTTLQWRAAKRRVTLDDIEHRVLRPSYHEPLIHFAVNCASTSCPPLAADPYREATLTAQLEAAARRYLASPLGLVIRGDTLWVSSIFKWYGDDFVGRFLDDGPASGRSVDRAVLGTIAVYGPDAARDLARSGRARVEHLDYDWSLNDVAGPAR